MCHLTSGLLLKVVRRKPLIVGTGEDLEVSPRAAGDPPKQNAVVRIQLPSSRRASVAEKIGDVWGSDPHHQQRQRAWESMRSKRQDGRKRDSREHGGDPHLPPNEAPGVSGGKLFGGTGGGCPLEQTTSCQKNPNQRSHDGVDGNGGVMRQEDQQEQPAARLVGEPLECAGERAAPASPREAGDQVREDVAAGSQNAEHRPQGRMAREDQPARDQHRDERRRQETPAEVVDNLPLIDPGQTIANATATSARHGAPQPRKELPVPTDPAVLAARELEILPGKRLVQHDVGREGCATVDAFEQVVARESVLRHAAVEAAAKRLDVVGTLADIDAGPEQVLIHVGDGAAVDVDGGVAGEPPSEPRTIAALG